MSRSDLARALYVLRHEGVTQLLAKSATRLLRSIVPLTPVESELVLRAFEGFNLTGTMIDVGAGTGTVLAPFIDAGWQVFAFEPDPTNRNKLSAVLSNKSGLRIDPRAVSDVDQAAVPLFTSDESLGVSSLVPFLNSHVQTHIVDSITLKTYMAETGIRRVDFLKIDAEGSDLKVLRGYPWEVAPPAAIMCEFDEAKTRSLGYSWTDLTELLTERGYRVIVSEWAPVDRYGETKAWTTYKVLPDELEDSSSWGNLIAAQADELFDALAKIFSEFSKRRERRLKSFGPIIRRLTRI